MKVRDLIKQLKQCKPDSRIIVAVRTYTQQHTVATVTPFSFDQTYNGATIWIQLPDDMHTVQRKKDA